LPFAEKVTVPDGVPAVDETVAAKVTEDPGVAEDGAIDKVVAVGNGAGGWDETGGDAESVNSLSAESTAAHRTEELHPIALIELAPSTLARVHEDEAGLVE